MAPPLPAQTPELPVYPALPLDRIRLIGPDDDPAAAYAALAAADAIGFDTESKPTFRKGEISTGPHLVQLATEHRAWLFPIARLSDLSGLRAILESPQVCKVGLGLGNDRSALHSRYGIALHNVFDLGEALRGVVQRGTVGAKAAVAHFFGQRLIKSKKISTSNWAQAQLSEAQLRYAANDAHVALRLYRAWQGASSAKDSRHV